MGNEFLVSREILDKKNRIGETDYEGEIVRTGDDLLEEAGGGLLLEAEAALNGGAGIDDETQAERQLGLIAQREHRRGRLMIVTESMSPAVRLFTARP